MEFLHRSVLLEETVDSLCVKPGGIYADGTLGGGGHSLEIAKRLEGRGMLVGIDRDEAALKEAGRKLESFGDLIRIVRGNYSEMPAILAELGIGSVDGIVLDLGVSSYQLDEASRGFSYMKDAPLDMRMDQREARTAADLLNTAEEGEILRILRDYGEERFAGRIARSIVMRRREKPLRTTGELAKLVEEAIPARFRKNGGHPAKKTFQAVRIEINGELSALEGSLEGMAELLCDGGRLSVITFHSLEDRIVKNAFRRLENPCTCPPEFPVCVCGKKPKGRVVTKKPILPSPVETEENSRAKSAKLRVFERIRGDANAAGGRQTRG